MKFIKSALLTGVGVTTLSLSGAGIASANSSDGAHKQTKDSHSSRTINRSNINQAGAKDANNKPHSDKWAEIKAKRVAKLQQAVASGQITQYQANYISNAWDEIYKIAADAKVSGNRAEAKTQIKQKADDLKIWANAQGIDLKLVFYPSFWGHHHGWSFSDGHKKSH